MEGTPPGHTRPAIRIDPSDEESRRLWEVIAELSGHLKDRDWSLVGGLMVQLHAYEHAASIRRATTDIDILANARKQDLRLVADALMSQGFDLDTPDLDGVVHRLRRGDVELDLLAPDGLKEPAVLYGTVTTFSAPGGTQALARTETVEVEIDSRRFRLRRPSLLGAVLMKARALPGHKDLDAQRADLVLLLSLIDDPRELAAEISRAERRWLNDAQDRLALDDPDATAGIPSAQLQRARQAYRILLG